MNIMQTINSTYSGKEKRGVLSGLFITWRVISNSYDDKAKVKSEFIFKNEGQIELTDSNWQLFYNQSPRNLISTLPESLVHIERISGDWHRIYPLKGFLLSSGKNVSVVYESSDFYIKESDSPTGLYFEFEGIEGGSEIVTDVNFSVLPFKNQEQVCRHQNDFISIPTAESRWQDNKSLKLLPGSELMTILPSPFRIRDLNENVLLSRELKIYYGKGLEFEANYLKTAVQKICNCNIVAIQGTSDAGDTISLQIENVFIDGKNEEVYALGISNDKHIAITGSDKSGVFYGIQSLLALMGQDTKIRQQLNLPVFEIQDAPRFGYRGMHLDVARNFQSVATLKKMIDILANYKINSLHLHLTDDEGWRLEIKAIPELTDVGAQRIHAEKYASALHPSYGSGPFPYAKDSHGSGFYSQEEFVDLLKYAKQRHINVVPEINLPGHARAAIKSMEARYERFIRMGDEDAANEFRLIDPEETSIYLSAQFYDDNVVNVARESVYHFYETVLDAVIDMYKKADVPLNMVHVGGDEVPKGAWTDSPMIREKMQQLSYINDPANMHGYYNARILEIHRIRNLKMAGWEEVALKKTDEGKLVPDIRFAGGHVIPYIWNNLWGAQDLAYKLANRNFPVIQCHVTAFYFDLAYNKDPQEPGLYWAGFVDTRNAWNYNPYNVFCITSHDQMGRKIDEVKEYRDMERLRVDAQKNVLGLQAQLWSETIKGPEMLEYYLLPKLLGFAESAWAKPRAWENITDPGIRNQLVEESWNVFANTLGQRELRRLSVLYGGYNYRIPMPGAVFTNGNLDANIEYPGLDIRYTTDGSNPDVNSRLYSGVIHLNADLVKLKAFDAIGRSSRTVIVENKRS
jgi:hexosaminidase